MNKTLVIDDLRSYRPELGITGVTYARTPDEGIDRLQNGGDWEEVILDHDMGLRMDDKFNYEYLDIRPVIRYIEANARDFQDVQFWCVTSSPSGEQYIVSALKNAGLHISVVPWADKARIFVGG